MPDPTRNNEISDLYELTKVKCNEITKKRIKAEHDYERKSEQIHESAGNSKKLFVKFCWILFKEHTSVQDNLKAGLRKLSMYVHQNHPAGCHICKTGFSETCKDFEVLIDLINEVSFDVYYMEGLEGIGIRRIFHFMKKTIETAKEFEDTDESIDIEEDSIFDDSIFAIPF